MSLSTVSFFDYDVTISTWRYVTLSVDSPKVEATSGGQHEEGWSRTWISWELEGDTVIYREYTDGRDCDGRMSTSSLYSCPVADLAKRDVYASGNAEASVDGPLPFRAPDWTEGRRSQRDYSAESAGY